MPGGTRRRLTEKERTLLRADKTAREYSAGMGGLEKTVNKPAPVTLPTFKCLEDEPDHEKRRQRLNGNDYPPGDM